MFSLYALLVSVVLYALLVSIVLYALLVSIVLLMQWPSGVTFWPTFSRVEKASS